MSKRSRNLNKAKAGKKKGPYHASLARRWEEVKTAWKFHEIEECLALLKSMDRMAPANPLIHLELGRMHGLIYDYSAAEESFDRCHRFAAPAAKTGMLARAGQLARDFYHPELSELFFARAVEAKDAKPEMFATFAEICERQRLVDKAEGLIEQALQRAPLCGQALVVRARLQRRAGQLEDAGNTLRPLVQDTIPKEIRVRAGYELGAILDREGRYDEAMEAFLQAKSLLHAEGVRLRTQRQLSIERIHRMREEITPEILRRWFEQGSELQPARRMALLGGHPRSGTTLLEQVLDSHDGIVSAEETNHFRDYVAQPISRRWKADSPIVDIWESVSGEELRAARSNYFGVMEKCLGEPQDGRLLIDKNPSQTLSIPALVRVFPEIRFLITLRDPRDVVMSCFMQPMLPVQEVNATWLELGTAAEEYVSVMGAWRDLAPILENSYLEVRYEDMVADLKGVARRTLEFLGVPWDERVLEFDAHARQKPVRSPTYADVTRKVYSSSQGRWRNYQKYLEPHLPTLEPLVKALGYE